MLLQNCIKTHETAKTKTRQRNRVPALKPQTIDVSKFQGEIAHRVSITQDRSRGKYWVYTGVYFYDML